MTLAGKTVLVTGATGFLGGALAMRLAQEGVSVRALARRPEKGDFLRAASHIEIVQGSINDAERMAEVSQGCDYVFHSAAALGGNFQEQQIGNVEGTRTVMVAAAGAKVKRVVHVSSISVYGFGYRSDVDEAMPQKPGSNAYNRTKSEAETVVREIGAQWGVKYSILRPGMIYGPRSNMWTRNMFKLAKRNPTIFLGDGSGSAYPIFVDDVVDMMLVLAEHPAGENQAFNCTPDPSPTWREFLGEYARLAGHQRWLGLPVLPVQVIAPLAEYFLKLYGDPQDLPDVVAFGLWHITYRMDKARDLLNWQPKVSLREGVERCVPWLRVQGLLENDGDQVTA